jgi:hypothetical protein
MGARPCGMCGHVCWQCQNTFDRLAAELDRLETEFASLRLAYAEADDRDTPVIGDQLADVQDAMDETAGALTAMEDGEWQ